jgi:hypothetical protein
MAERSRGTVLTIFAILFGLLALSNFMKPFLQGSAPAPKSGAGSVVAGGRI